MGELILNKMPGNLGKQTEEMAIGQVKFGQLNLTARDAKDEKTTSSYRPLSVRSNV